MDVDVGGALKRAARGPLRRAGLAQLLPDCCGDDGGEKR